MTETYQCPQNYCPSCIQSPAFTRTNTEVDAVPVAVLCISWLYTRHIGYTAHTYTVLPTRNTCTDCCRSLKPSVSKAITSADQMWQIVNCYFNLQVRNALKILNHLLLLAFQMLGYLSLEFKPTFDSSTNVCSS